LGRYSISRSELARRLGVDMTWVGKRLNGQTEITLADLDRMATALDVQATEFLPTSTRASSPTPLQPLAARVVAVGGEHRKPRRNSHLPAQKPVRTQRNRPVTPIAV
jgi:transcriptional regulator with XRE-family HTH domain